MCMIVYPACKGCECLIVPRELDKRWTRVEPCPKNDGYSQEYADLNVDLKRRFWKRMEENLKDKAKQEAMSCEDFKSGYDFFLGQKCIYCGQQG